MRAKIVNAMLAARYQIKWDLWECARELYCNMLDADPDFTCEWSVDAEGRDVLMMRTRTAPTLSNLMVMGSGTKEEGGDTIGQFGEGGKLAALVAARRRNTLLKIQTPSGEVTPQIATAKGFDEQTLHLRVDPAGAIEKGCRVELHANGLRELLDDRMLPREHMRTYGYAEKAKGAKGMRVYVKGVYIKRLNEASLFDWNLEHCTLNRDRDMPDTYHLRAVLGKMVAAVVVKDAGMADRIRDSSDSYEAKALEQYFRYYNDEEAALAMEQSVRRKYGEDMVVASASSYDNLQAASKGHNVVALPDTVRNMLGDKVKKASEVLTLDDRMTQVSNYDLTEEERQRIDLLHQLGKLLNAPYELRIFEPEPSQRSLHGRAEWGGNRLVVWVNRTQLTASLRECVHTFLHELAHLKSKAGDETHNFELGLGDIAALFAVKLLTPSFEMAGS